MWFDGRQVPGRQKDLDLDSHGKRLPGTSWASHVFSSLSSLVCHMGVLRFYHDPS